VGFEEFQSAGEAGRNAFAIARSAQIPGDSDDTDDDAVMIAHREFRRQTPTGPAMRVPMQFQMIDDRAAGADNGLVPDWHKVRPVLSGRFPARAGQGVPFYRRSHNVRRGID